MTTAQNTDTSVLKEAELLRKVYAAFNRRDVEAVLAAMQGDVDWPNGWEGGRVRGKGAVREYWLRQFQALNPRVHPQGFTAESDGRVAVRVHQIVHDVAGNLLFDGVIQHVYEFRDGLIASMEIGNSLS